MEDFIQSLNRKLTYLQSLKGRDKIRQGRVFIDDLYRNPRSKAVINDIKSSTEAKLMELAEFDRSLYAELKSIKDEFVRRAPDFDDTDMTEPQPGGPIRDYETSFAFFELGLDEKAERQTIPMMVSSFDDRTNFCMISNILFGKIANAMNGYVPATGQIDEVAQREDLSDLRKRLNKIKTAHTHQHRKFIDHKLTNAGPAMFTMENMYEEANPEPYDYDALTPEDHRYKLSRALHGHGDVLAKAMYTSDHLTVDEEREISALADFIDDAATRIHDEIVSKLGSQLSNIALLERYKSRCEWHARLELHRIAVARGKAEDKLADNLALWLFDQGMNPLTRSKAAGLEPDLLDPSTRFNLYVEAKQYSQAKKPYIIQGVAQMIDTIGRLHGTPYEVKEGFYVVYRLGGPRYVLPKVLNIGEWTIYPVLIDIAGSKVSGSRQRNKPVLISEQDLLGR